MLPRQARQKGVILIATDKGFKFQKYVYNKCHDKSMINKLMISRNLSNITILNIDGVNYCCIIEAKKLIQNVNISEKKEHQKTKKIIKTFGDIEIEKHKIFAEKFQTQTYNLTADLSDC